MADNLQTCWRVFRALTAIAVIVLAIAYLVSPEERYFRWAILAFLGNQLRFC